MTTTPMLDVAHYDGRQILTTNPYTYAYHAIDWAQARAKWPAVIIKQGQGLNSDPLFAKQYQAARGHVKRGLYHFFATGANAIQAAAKCLADLEAADAGMPELGLWLDLETNPQALSGSQYLSLAASWLNEIGKGVPADTPLGIYSRKTFWDPLYIAAGSPSWPRDYWAWVARYPFSSTSTGFPAYYDRIVHQGVYPTPTANLAGFALMAAWQWTDKGKPVDVPGYPRFKQSVDFNLLYMDVAPPPAEPTDAEKLTRLWEHHPELH